MKDSTPIILGVAALAAALYFQMQNAATQREIGRCRDEFKGFKEGVIYGK